MDRTLSLLVKFAALDKLTQPLKKIGLASKNSSKDLASTTRELAALERAQGKLAGIKSLRAGISDGYGKLDEMRRGIRLLREEIARTDSPTKRLTNSLASAERQEARMAAATGIQSAKLQKLQAELQAAGVDARDFGRAEVDLAANLDSVNRRLEVQRRRADGVAARERRSARMSALGSRVQSIGGSATVAGGAVLAPIALGARSATQFESAMADVRKVVDGLESPRALANMREEIFALSRELPIAADGIAAIIAAGGQAGFPRGELVGFTRDAARMSVAFDSTADEAGDTMAKWRTAFNLSQPAVVNLADKVNFLSDRTAASATQISDIVTRIGPLGGVAGLASGEIAALSATLASMGIGEEIAATGIKNTMLALTKGEAATKDQKKAFEALGLEAVKTSKAMQMDASGTIVDVMTRVSKLSKDRQASVLTQLFGSESIAAIAPLLSQLPTLQANLKLVGENGGYAGSMMREFTSRSGTSANKLQLMANRVEIMKIKLGDQLLPAIVKVSEKIGSLADRVSAFADRNPELAGSLLKIGAVLGVLLVTFGTLGLVVGPLIAGFGTFMTIIGGLWTAISFGFGVIASLLGAFATITGLPFILVAALAAGLVALYVYWDQVKAAFGNGLQWFVGLHVQMFSIGANLVRGLLNGIGSMFGALKDKIVGLGKNAVGWFKNVLGIHSPSRVFADLGGHLTSGLSIGIDRGAAGPLDRIRGLAGRVASTAATITGAVGMAALPVAAAPGPAAPPPPAAGAAPVHYHNEQFHLHLPPGAGADVRAQARELWEEIKRLQASERAGGYGDD